MWTKFWRLLAGCIAIECAAAEYRAGVASVDGVTAVVVEDRRGFRAAFAEADFPISRTISDLVAIELIKAADFDRAGLVISGRGAAAAEPRAIVIAVGNALRAAEDATVSYRDVISLANSQGGCIASLYPVRAAGGCRGGAPVHGLIRAAFEMLDLPHGLREPARAYPIQAVAIGKSVTVLGLGGQAPAGRFARPARIVVPFANDAAPMPEGMDAAITRMLKRLR